jgi:hypothetical protein
MKVSPDESGMGIGKFLLHPHFSKKGDSFPFTVAAAANRMKCCSNLRFHLSSPLLTSLVTQQLLRQSMMRLPLSGCNIKDESQSTSGKYGEG